MNEKEAVTGLVGNCDLCGKARTDLKLEMVINGEPQYLGACCKPKSGNCTKPLNESAVPMLVARCAVPGCGHLKSEHRFELPPVCLECDNNLWEHEFVLAAAHVKVEKEE